MQSRPAVESDFPGIFEIFRLVVASGDTYAFSLDAGENEAHAYWFSPNMKSFVVVDENKVLGIYKYGPNNPGRGRHVANASFMVHPDGRGRGIGLLMGQECLRRAKADAFKAMQFNYVISTNTPAVALWKKLGFEVVGTLPRAFMHSTLGEVDVFVMYRFLNDVQVDNG